MITIKEMANILGVSTTTINNVIHGKTSEVSKSTIKRVQKAIEEYEYIPNMNARNLAQNKSKIIGVAMKAGKDKYENTIKDPYIGEIVGVIERCVRASEYFMMIYISNDINEIMKYVSTWNVDGLILFGMTGDDCIKIRKKFKKPMVYIDSYFNHDIMEHVNVGLEDRKGAYEITKYLLECRHEKIAFLADNCIGVNYERFIGYKTAMEEVGILHKEEDLFLISQERHEISSCLAEIYNYSTEYTALFCASDYYAALIINYLQDNGKSIPEDISIVGFDDNRYAQMVRPALTTVHQNVTEKGEVAVEALLTLMEGEALKECKIILPTKLVIRDTVKKLN